MDEDDFIMDEDEHASIELACAQAEAAYAAAALARGPPVDYFELLPNEILEMVLLKLPWNWNLVSKQVCKRWRDTCANPVFAENQALSNGDRTAASIRFMRDVAESNCLGVMQWARSQGCPWDISVTEAAANAGHADLLKWARENGCPWNPSFVCWSDDQKAAFHLAMKRYNVFLTGPGGGGKSKVLMRIIAGLRDAGLNVVVTASTGIAALAVGGTTLHSVFNQQLGTDSPDRMARRIRAIPETYKTWMTMDVLVIDEVSMLSAPFWSSMDKTLRILRGSRKPFGDIQVILCGDFFQLPPVVKRNNPHQQQQQQQQHQRYKNPDENKLFCFQLDVWQELELCVINLNTVFRQENGVFSETLNRVRTGKITQADDRLLASRNNVQPVGMIVTKDDGTEVLITPTVLKPLRQEVDQVNEAELKKLTTKPYIFNGRIEYMPPMNGRSPDPARLNTWIERTRKHFVENAPVAEQFVLKAGAQVILTVNMPELGLVNGSRGVILNMKATTESTATPMVLFENRTEEIAITTFTWMLYDPTFGRLLYYQNPLKLAWALTIHKCQGMTLNCAEIALGKVFERHQLYVAISRVKDIKGLYLKGYHHSRIKVHPDVVWFYNNIEYVDVAVLKTIQLADRERTKPPFEEEDIVDTDSSANRKRPYGSTYSSSSSWGRSSSSSSRDRLNKIVKRG